MDEQVKIQRFLEKSQNKKVGKDGENRGEPGSKVEEKLKKRVTKLMKQKKLRALRQTMNEWDGSKPWGQNIKAKVCVVLVISGERLIVTDLHSLRGITLSLILFRLEVV